MERCALIAESDPNVRQEIIEVVESLGHNYECCSNQKTAINFIETKKLSYIVAGILMKVSEYGKSKNPDNCCHFLYQARKILPNIPIIITGPKEYATKGYAAKLVRAGAFDFVDLPEPSSGRSLSGSIRDALRREKKKEFDKTTVKDFVSGDMVFYDSRVELCGLILTDIDDFGLTHRFLNLLTKLTIAGKRICYSPAKLAKILKTTPEAVRTMLCRLRRSIFVGMRKERNIKVGIDEIIPKKPGKGGGYCLSEKVNIVFRTSNAPEDNPEKTYFNNFPSRQQKIIDFLCRQGSISKTQVEHICECSARTAQRELAFLRDEGYIVFEGHGARGRWRFSPDWRNRLCKLPAEET